MTFRDLLREHNDAIVQRWCDAALKTYAEKSAMVFKRSEDPFGNPVGHSLRVGTRGIFETLLNGTDIEKIRNHLHEIIKIRAVQELSASHALCFVFRLKEAVRETLGPAAKDGCFASELEDLDERIDQIALAAFDVFVHYRERLSDLRVNEVKRSVSWVADKINRRRVDQEAFRVGSGLTTIGETGTRREGVS